MRPSGQGEILVERFRTSINVSYKGRGNIVTDVDTEVEEEVLDILRREYPDMGLLGEESAGKRADAGYVWIVDPLDGTRNYASGIPFFSTVIGLALDGEVLVGVNYDPVRGDLFEAERGGGAFLNGERAAVSERTELAESIIGTDLSYNNRGAANGLEVVREIWPGMQTARIMGSAALGLSYAADGPDGPLLPPPAGTVGPGRRDAACRGGGRSSHRSDGKAGRALQRWHRGIEPGPAHRVHAAHRRHGVARVHRGQLSSGRGPTP